MSTMGFWRLGVGSCGDDSKTAGSGSNTETTPSTILEHIVKCVTKSSQKTLSFFMLKRFNHKPPPIDRSKGAGFFPTSPVTYRTGPR